MRLGHVVRLTDLLRALTPNRSRWSPTTDKLIGRAAPLGAVARAGDRLNMLHISNSGWQIVACNFWEMELARAGKVFLSINAGCFRLLLPESLEHALAHMQDGAQGDRRRDQGLRSNTLAAWQRAGRERLGCCILPAA